MRKLVLLSLSVIVLACGHEPRPRALLAPPQDSVLPSSAYLALLPDGVEKRQFILDCTGCHTFHAGIAYPSGAVRTHDSWSAAISRMLQSFGASSGFPVIAASRDAAATARWLSDALPARPEHRWHWPSELEGRAEIREYALPVAGDLPHDVAVIGNEVAVTGMFTAQLYWVDAERGTVRTEPTPQPNPRAIEMDAAGNAWVVLGNPELVARRTPGGDWRTFPAGFYAHSVAIAPDGGVWVNGHFTHQPELIRRIDPVTGATRDFTVPAHPSFTNTPVPYEIRVASDGVVWMSELQGNRLVRLDPKTGAFKTWMMPTSASGPRRLDIDPAGNVWIPEYTANRIARFDPRTETFQEFPLPIGDAAPYIVRWDARRSALWIGTGAADAVLRFDPRSGRFTWYRLPTPDAMIRHLTIDARTGDVWLAPGSSPAARPAARIVRLRPNDERRPN